VKIEVDRDICVGAGNCVLTAPDLFDQDEDGIVVLLSPEPTAEQEKAVEVAVTRCPSGALSRG
jgi:ferredoxin